MSSAVDIQIVSPPNLEKIERFFKDSAYRETIEFSANFNTRLCIERRLRLPFIDPQTGVAQNHSQLFVDRRQRMPGFRQGQIYTYPAARWRKSRRQYLNKMYRFPERPFQSLRKEHQDVTVVASASAAIANIAAGTASPTVSIANLGHDPDFNGLLEESSSMGAFGGDTSDSNSQHQTHPPQQPSQSRDDLTKEWFYDDMDMNDVDSLEDPKSPADDEYDYDPRYGSKKRRKRRPSKRASQTPGDGVGRRRSGATGRGRTLTGSNANDTSFSMDSMDGLSCGGGGGPSAGVDIVASTPTSSGGGRRLRGTGTRGRRRTKAANTSNACNPPSPGMPGYEPPSFASAAAAVGVSPSDMAPVAEEHGDLRNYRKYL